MYHIKSHLFIHSSGHRIVPMLGFYTSDCINVVEVVLIIEDRDREGCLRTSHTLSTLLPILVRSSHGEGSMYSFYGILSFQYYGNVLMSLFIARIE